MVSFVTLDAVDHPLDIGDVGELAWELARLHRLGCAVAPAWVLPSDLFEKVLQGLVNREPLFAEWPYLLGQAELSAAVSLPRLTHRLRQALPMAQIPLAWEPLLAQIPTPVVRLQPSLWWGLPGETAPFSDLLGNVVCWADEHSLQRGLKLLWSRILSGASWAYWQRSPRPPTPLKVAIVIQPLPPIQVSGRMNLRATEVTIELLRGYDLAFEEAQPDRYQGGLLICNQTAWQPGNQECLYQILEDYPDAGGERLDPEGCLKVQPIRRTALAEFEPALLQPLIHQLTPLLSPTTPHWRLHWCQPLGHSTIQVTQALPWPLVAPTPWDSQASAPRAVAPPGSLQGLGAAPGTTQGIVHILGPGQQPPADLTGQILVAPTIFPSWLPQLKTALGLVAEQGGVTSHGAILARELGMPAVVGCAGAVAQLQAGDWVWLDGDRGVVAPWPPGSSRAEDMEEKGAVTSAPVALPPGPERLQLWVNLTQPEGAAIAAQWPVAGVGLLRAEWLMMPILQGRHPYHWLAQGDGAALQAALVAQLRPILGAFAPRPVRYRSLDLRSHEMASLVGAPPPETNPMLGLRGTLSYQYHPALFQLELSALRQLQREGYQNSQLLLPFVRTVEEFNYCRGIVQAMNLPQGVGFELWMMAEVPSVLFLLEAYQAAGAQGIAIGTHDLTQLLLGVDRDQGQLAQVFDEGHPAVQGAIAQLLRQAQTLGLPVTLCGLSPQRREQLLPHLLRWGLKQLSVEVPALGPTLAALRALPPPLP